MPTKVSIAMDRYGLRGWVFCLRWKDQHTGEPMTLSCRTNSNGGGLWYSKLWSMEKTLLYSDQEFKLNRNRAPAYQKIRRWALKQLREKGSLP